MPWRPTDATAAARITGSFSSVAASTASTTVIITNAGAGDIELVLSVCPSSPVTGGVSRVAAFQTVSSSVRLDLSQDATLYWLASAYAAGELAPNQAGQVYTDDADRFQLDVTRDIVVSHDSNGWSLPAYNSTQFTVHVGFGLQIRGWVYWGYSVLCSPQQSVVTRAGSYELARSDGHEQIGDPVVIQGTSDWQLPIGYSYLLAFDASGNGTLTRT